MLVYAVSADDEVPAASASTARRLAGRCTEKSVLVYSDVFYNYL